MTSTSKYRAQPTVVDGIRFASRKEAKRYGELKLLERAGSIEALTLQPRVPLVAAAIDATGSEPCFVPTFVAEYVADFRYRDCASGRMVWEDVKGFRTRLYRLKKKFAEACLGVTIVEI